MPIVIGWVVAGCCCGAGLAVVLRHIYHLQQYPPTARRQNMVGVCLMAPVRARTELLQPSPAAAASARCAAARGRLGGWAPHAGRPSLPSRSRSPSAR